MTDQEHPDGSRRAPRRPLTHDHRWWQSGAIYQIYPRSFADSNGDGEGDLAGIRSRLDHPEWLGVDAVWISPFFPSPMVDGGYDVSDYCDVDPRFGTLEEFDGLVAELHRRELRVILDLVPNHTSDQHPWFVESRRTRDSAKRDWYLWRDPAPDGGPPNNWRSEFGGSAWTLDPPTGQYYYHAFAEEQPDLNWRNRRVREAMYDVMRFWLDRGVDGFRVDVMWHMVKDEQFRDNPQNPDYREGVESPSRRLVPVYSADQPEIHEVVAEMRAVLEEYEDRLMIGEIYLPVDRLVDYYGARGDGAHLPFNFHLILTPWDAREIELVIDRYEGALPEHAWPNWVLGNHDQSRIASRVGEAQARVAAVLLLTLRGTPTIYYGDEIGMHDVEIPPTEALDVRDANVPGRGLGRDPYRTPMQWDASPNAGFGARRPWLPVALDHKRRNVANQRDEPTSMLRLYRRLLELRNTTPALSVGHYQPLPAGGSLLAYRRELAGESRVIVLNLGHGSERLELAAEVGPLRALLSATGRVAGTRHAGELVVPGDEALILAPEG